MPRRGSPAHALETLDLLIQSGIRVDFSTTEIDGFYCVIAHDRRTGFTASTIAHDLTEAILDIDAKIPAALRG